MHELVIVRFGLKEKIHSARTNKSYALYIEIRCEGGDYPAKRWNNILAG